LSKFQKTKNYVSIIAEGSNGNSILLKSSDQGISWTVYNYPDYYYCQRLNFVNDDFGYTLCNNSIYKTINGGESWEESNAPPGFTTLESVIHFNTPEEGFAIYPEYGVEGTGINQYLVIEFYHVFQTNDGGNTWAQSEIGDECGLDGVFYSPSNEIFFTVGFSTSTRFELK